MHVKKESCGPSLLSPDREVYGRSEGSTARRYFNLGREGWIGLGPPRGLRHGVAAAMSPVRVMHGNPIVENPTTPWKCR